jgi:hypothetical protein
VVGYASRQASLEVPRPGRAGLPFLVLGAAALLLEVDPRLPWLAGIASAALFALAGAVRAVRAAVELGRLRRTTDELIHHRGEIGTMSAVVAWRVTELTSIRRRDAVARSVDRALRGSEASRLPGAVPLNRVAVRRSEELLRLLGDRLRDSSRPVTARGVLAAEQLLGDPLSPLYAPGRSGELPRGVTKVLSALEP